MTYIRMMAVSAALLLAACANTRPTSEACAATDESGGKSAECAGAILSDGADAALDAWSLIDLIGFLVH